MSVLSPIDIGSLQDAVHAWFSEATGLFTVWRDQSAPQPEYPFGTLQIISGPNPLSPTWEKRIETLVGQPQGEEIKITVCNQCTFDVSCQAFVGMSEARDPSINALNFLSKAQTALNLPSVQSGFTLANIAYNRVTPVQSINEIIADSFISRANIDVTFNAVLSLAEYTGYIETVAIKSTSLGIDEEFGG